PEDVERLRRWWETDREPGVHSAVDWLLRRWDEGYYGKELARREESKTEARQLARGRRWYVTREGRHTLAVIEDSELGRFAIGTREVTVQQFQSFATATKHSWERRAGDPLDSPVTMVRWF